MSKELADKVGLTEGEKAIYIDDVGGGVYLISVTVTEVFADGIDDIKVKCAEFEGWLRFGRLYSKEKIMKMLGEQ